MVPISGMVPDELEILAVLVLDKLEEADHVHQNHWIRAVTVENNLAERLSRSLSDYAKDRLTHTEAVDGARTAFEMNRRDVLVLGWTRVQNMLHKPLTLPDPERRQLLANLAGKDSKRLGDFTQILTDQKHPPDSEYWSTWEGLRSRIQTIAHDTTWRDLNQTVLTTMQIEAPLAIGFEPSPVWRTAEDPDVCQECRDNEITYNTIEEALLVEIPVHPFCRCYWDFDVDITDYEGQQLLES